MEILKIVTIALTGVILASLMKTVNKEVSIYVISATAIIIFFSIIIKLTDVFSFIENIYNGITYGKEFFPIVLKILAIAYITDLTAQLCKDAGEGAIASKVELGGKVVIFYAAMPIMNAILDLIKTLLA
ncbi:MAG: SpoIIIAC/SpoIIIAD family protein [Bacillota bacterium]|nr:SpoIIIAC/SpoIIIAD family protein [Bacillota bacterium]